MVTAIEKFLSGKQLEGKPVRVADTRLRYSPANSKLAKMYDDPEIMEFLGNRKIYSLDLLSGHTCPFAKFLIYLAADWLRQSVLIDNELSADCQQFILSKHR